MTVVLMVWEPIPDRHTHTQTECYNIRLLTSILIFLQNFVTLMCLEVAFPKLGFSVYWSVIYRPDNLMSKIIFDFMPDYIYQNLVKML